MTAVLESVAGIGATGQPEIQMNLLIPSDP